MTERENLRQGIIFCNNEIAQHNLILADAIARGETSSILHDKFQQQLETIKGSDDGVAPDSPTKASERQFLEWAISFASGEIKHYRTLMTEAIGKSDQSRIFRDQIQKRLEELANSDDHVC